MKHEFCGTVVEKFNKNKPTFCPACGRYANPGDFVANDAKKPEAGVIGAEPMVIPPVVPPEVKKNAGK